MEQAQGAPAPLPACEPAGQPHHRSTSLTSLRLESSRLGNRGCRQLAAALPALRELRLVSRAVDDRGLKALCTLPKVRWFAV
jgi:hypothetical protein